MTKTNPTKAWLMALLLGTGALLIGCSEPGPAEQAGAEVDEAMEEAGDAMDEAGDRLEEAGESAEETVEEAID